MHIECSLSKLWNTFFCGFCFWQPIYHIYQCVLIVVHSFQYYNNSKFSFWGSHNMQDFKLLRSFTIEHGFIGEFSFIIFILQFMWTLSVMKLCGFNSVRDRINYLWSDWSTVQGWLWHWFWQFYPLAICFQGLKPVLLHLSTLVFYYCTNNCPWLH